MRFAATWLLPSVTALLPAQRTWIVDVDGRPGADFLDLPAAVSGAAPGDTLLVRPSRDWAYTAPLIDKSLRIHALNRDLTVYAPISMYGLLRIRGIPSSGTLLLDGFSIFGSFIAPWGIDVANCDGLVHVGFCVQDRSTWTGAIAEFRNCRQLRFHACDLYGRGAPILFQNCTVEAIATRFTAIQGEGAFAPYGHFQYSARAVRLVDSTLTLTDSLIRGADEHRSAGTEALDLLRSTAIVGGTSGVIGGYYNPWPFQAACAVGQGTIRRDPRATLPGPPLEPGVIIVPEWRYETACGRVERNHTFLAAVIGPPNGFGLLALGYPQTAPMPGPLGDLWLDPQRILYVAAGPLDNHGIAVRTLFCHPEVPMDTFFAFQGGWLAPDCSFGLTHPSPFTVLWEPGRPFP